MINTVPQINTGHHGYCQNCFELQCILDRKEDEIIRLKQRVALLEKRNKEGFFGSSTPSSKKPFKENSKPAAKKKNGGGRKGHRGYGRSVFSREEADDIRYHNLPEHCEECGGSIISKGEIERFEIDIEPVKIKKIVHVIKQGRCSVCNKHVTGKSGLLSKSLYGNQLISHLLCHHFFYGITVGKIEQMLKKLIRTSSMHNIFQRIGKIFEPCNEKIIFKFRKEKVKHADETTWRTDGKNGYTWLFGSKNCTIFKFGKTRSASVALDVFGREKLPGYTVVDRYGGYNKIKGLIQYCFAHLLRMVTDYGEKYPDKKEVQNFVNALASLLTEAIQLRQEKITNKSYYRRAKKLKRNILQIINHPAADFGIQNIQMTFKKNEYRLYHWVKDRDVPADNNTAERELRSVVIARKISFGSQSEKGANTRSTLMTVLFTTQKRLKNKTLEQWLKEALDKIAQNPSIEPYSLLPIPCT